MGQNIVQSAQAISLIDLAYSLLIALGLGLLIVSVYRLTHRGFHYERSFLTTLVMISPIVALVMLLIGSNLALSLGMVGALSIIRFRTVIKDSRDMVYLFLAIAAGLGCGTYNWSVALLAVSFVCVSLVFLNMMRFGKSVHADYVLVLGGSSGTPPESKIKAMVQPHVLFLETRSLNVDEGQWELVLELRLGKDADFPNAALQEALKQDCGVSRLSLLAPQLSLPV